MGKNLGKTDSGAQLIINQNRCVVAPPREQNKTLRRCVAA